MKIPGTCTEYNCIEPVMATGLCSRHYLRNWRERQRMKKDAEMSNICLESVDPALAYPDPRSPSLEHVVPLSRGGAHDPSNVVIAHLRCNLSKGARTLPVGNLTP